MQTDVEYANGRQANAIVGDLCCECRNLRNQTRKECYALRTEELIKQSRPEISRDPSALCGAISSSAGAASSPAIEISRRSEWDVLFFCVHQRSRSPGATANLPRRKRSRDRRCRWPATKATAPVGGASLGTRPTPRRLPSVFSRREILPK